MYTHIDVYVYEICLSISCRLLIEDFSRVHVYSEDDAYGDGCDYSLDLQLCGSFIC